MIVLTTEEARRLVAAVDLSHPFGRRDRAMLVLAFHTGLRVSELASLDAADVANGDVPRETLFVRAEIGKGGKSRVIPLNDIARKAVASLLLFNQARGFSVEPKAPLLVTRKHTRLSVRSIQRIVEELRTKAHLDVPATPHSMRHTFASHIAKRTGNVRVVQQLLGHARLNTAEIYVTTDRGQLEDAVAQLAKGVV
jgi:site-specific recombinase XerD